MNHNPTGPKTYATRTPSKSGRSRTAAASWLASMLLLVATPTLGTDDEEATRQAHETVKRAVEQGDYPTALRTLRPLAEQGDAEAQLQLGFMYQVGRGVPRDGRQALYWYIRAAEQGHALAQHNLAVMYYEGKSVPREQRAMHWFTKAAEQELAQAQYSLGHMYYEGKGAPRDERQAMHWFAKAAKQGYVLAQLSMGLMFGRGEGVPQDFVRAYAWLSLAATNKNDQARVARDSLREIMTAEQIKQGHAFGRTLDRIIAIRTGVDP